MDFEMTIDGRIKKLEEFKKAVLDWEQSYKDEARRTELRTYININKKWVQREVVEAGCMQRLTIAPPPAVGGLIMRDVNPFDVIFDGPYGLSVIDNVVDMIEQAIGVLIALPDMEENTQENSMQEQIKIDIQKNYAFIAMAIDPKNPELEDVLDSIKEAASRCGIEAERVDEVHSNEKITDRILESIKKAEFVIIDLTYSRPNVFYEAGYAQGIGKTPIYLAKEGTKLEFDLKDYPVIFFKNMKQLKDNLENRLRGL
jgi:nucleotide-binding universal stress UspA family protein